MKSDQISSSFLLDLPAHRLFYILDYNNPLQHQKPTDPRIENHYTSEKLKTRLWDVRAMCRAIKWMNIFCMHPCYHPDFSYKCTVDDGSPGGAKCSDFHIKEGTHYGFCCNCRRRFITELKEDEKALVEEDRQRIMNLNLSYLSYLRMWTFDGQ